MTSTCPCPSPAADYDPLRTPLEGPHNLPCGHWVHIHSASSRQRLGWDLFKRRWQACSDEDVR